jgi:thiol-disulfide isomerase/thioredoxin
MRSFILFSFFVLIFSINSLAQARRIPPPRPTNTSPTQSGENIANTSNSNEPVIIDGQTAAQMYEDARTYAKRKFDEFVTRKIPYSEDLRERTQIESKQLAAKYAAQLNTINLSGEDFYYLGSLHILAENTDGSSEAFKKFLASKDPNPEKAQTARAFIVVSAARRKDFAVAESALSEYLKNTPIVLRERVLVENELAQQYFAAKNYASAAAHADAAVIAGQAGVKDALVEPRLLEIFSEAGFTLFDIYAEDKQNNKAVATLEILRNAGATVQSTGLYTKSVGKLISFLIETGRKPEAMQIFKAAQGALGTDFRDPAMRAQVAAFLKNREKQYKIWGEAAPEIEVDRWIIDKNLDESQANSLSGMRGKVVLLDFWATWCKPCFASFPELTEWHETYTNQGLNIVGMTRYYGFANGLSADENGEFSFLQKFKRTERLPYPLAVAKNLKNYDNYGVFALPTIILIDKKGVVRYVDTGVRNEKEVETMIQKLLAED